MGKVHTPSTFMWLLHDVLNLRSLHCICWAGLIFIILPSWAKLHLVFLL